MGTRMAPQYANLFMALLESEFLKHYHLKPLIYLRFIDDTFMIWTHGEEELKNFHRAFNTYHNSINLKMDYSTESVHFLDTTVILKENQLQTSLYRKPTDRYSYLHPESFHPPHIKKSIVYSQALRYKRICSDDNDRRFHLNHLNEAFKSIGYPTSTINQQINRANNVTRQHSLQYNTERRKNTSRVPLVVTYHPSLKPLRRILHQIHGLIEDDEDLKILFPDPPLVSFRQTDSLHNKLVRSNQNRQTTENGTFPCKYPRCMTCANIQQGHCITFKNTTHYIHGRFTCESMGVVYMITCNKPSCASVVYIGETGQMLRRRMNGHRHSINASDNTKPVGAHFSQIGHTMNNLQLNILLGNLNNTDKRKMFELKLIKKFNAINDGLNIDSSYLGLYNI